jgi:hypothetical protein
MRSSREVRTFSGPRSCWSSASTRSDKKGRSGEGEAKE